MMNTEYFKPVSATLKRKLNTLANWPLHLANCKNCKTESENTLYMPTYIFSISSYVKNCKTENKMHADVQYKWQKMAAA